MNHRSPRAEATRIAIISAATACFAERGFEATSTRAIAARAGVSQPLIHHYFGDKEALVAAVLDQYVADYQQVQQHQWAREPDDVAFFTVGLRVLFYWLGADPLRNRVLAWARLEGRATASGAASQLHAQIRQRFVAARERRVVRSDLDADAAMMIIDAMFKGYWERRAVYLAGDAMTEAEVDHRFFREALPMLLRNLLSPEAAARASKAATLLEPKSEALTGGRSPTAGARIARISSLLRVTIITHSAKSSAVGTG